MSQSIFLYHYFGRPFRNSIWSRPLQKLPSSQSLTVSSMVSLYHRLTPSELVPVIDKYIVSVKDHINKLKQGTIKSNFLMNCSFSVTYYLPNLPQDLIKIYCASYTKSQSCIDIQNFGYIFDFITII